MSERTFTLSEAQQLLPVLESLLRTAIESKNAVEQANTTHARLQNRIFVSGGLRVDIVATLRVKNEGEKAAQRLKDAVAEITAAGVQVKDLNMGLLDFPCKVDDQIILLCWKMGEPTITHWHGTDEGFAGRKPIDARISGTHPENPDKPN
jgi:hypothetical protein